MVGFSRPKLFGVQIDGVHDVVQLLPALARIYPLGFALTSAVMFTGVVGLLLFTTTVHVRVTSALRGLCDRRKPTVFLGHGLLFGLVAMVIDLVIERRDAGEFLIGIGVLLGGPTFFEELLELNGALAFLFGSVALSRLPAERSERPDQVIR